MKYEELGGGNIMDGKRNTQERRGGYKGTKVYKRLPFEFSMGKGIFFFLRRTVYYNMTLKYIIHNK
jgi:hypothetical protein